MNYEQVSDFEINKAVAEALGYDAGWKAAGCAAIGIAEGSAFGRYVDYCNDPADAWPVILENEIATIPPVSNGTCGWKAERFYPQNCGTIFDWIDKNPLRAAMIVFLMMQEAK